MNKKGFIAILTVTLIGFIAAIFTVSSATRAYMQMRNVSDAQTVTVLRFNAISCIQIARLKIFLAETPLEGEYYTGPENCTIERVVVGSREVSITASAEKNDAKISFTANLDRNTLGIVSLVEII